MVVGVFAVLDRVGDRCCSFGCVVGARVSMKRKTFQLTSEDARGEKNNHARLTETIVRNIRRRRENGDGCRAPLPLPFFLVHREPGIVAGRQLPIQRAVALEFGDQTTWTLVDA